jgi:hypothetical protein
VILRLIQTTDQRLFRLGAALQAQQAADPEAAALAKKLLPLRELKDLGPAVFMDLAKFLRERLAFGPGDEGQLLFEAFYSYLLPQFEGIDAPAGEQLFQALSPLMGYRRSAKSSARHTQFSSWPRAPAPSVC